MHNAQTTLLLTLAALPLLHLRLALDIHQGTLLQAQDEIPPRARLKERSDSPPARVSVIFWTTAGRQAVLDDLVAAGGRSQLWGTSKVADKLDLGEWARWSGAEGAGGERGAQGAESLAGEHLGVFGLVDWCGGERERGVDAEGSVCGCVSA